MGPSKRALAHVARVAEAAARLLQLESDSRRTMTVQERADARSWYPVQRLKLEGIAVGADLPVEVVVHAAAALSPGIHWGTLLRDLPGFLAAAKVGDLRPPFATYGRNRELAARMVRQGLALGGEASGPKVRPFALALLGDATRVVVDRHVLRYALNLGPHRWDIAATGRDPNRLAPTAAERRAIQDAHRVAGAALGIAPRDLQALLWVARVGYGGDAGGSQMKRAGGRVAGVSP